MSAFETFKNGNHIFIYAIGGRSSSTALQRILNSSNEICIWGEAWGLDQIFLQFIHDIREKYEDLERRHPKKHLELLESSFDSGIHDQFYPNAFRGLAPTVDAIESVFVDLIKPVKNLTRFGYKEVRVSNFTMLETLLNLFGNCKIVFLFRNPMNQWVSIRDSGWFSVSSNLTKFLSEYNRIADIFIKVHEAYPDRTIFVENTQLFDVSTIKSIIRHLGIGQVDESLINQIVSSIKKAPLSDEEANLITRNAMPTYDFLRSLLFNNNQ